MKRQRISRNRQRLGAWALVGVVLTAPGGAALGRAGTAQRVVAADFEEKEVYRAPQKPGWTAWVSLWKSGGDVILSCLQITGDAHRRPSHNMAGLKKETVILRSKDGGKRWQRVAVIPSQSEPLPNGWVYNGGAFVSVQQISDGSLLGTRWGRDWGSYKPDEGLVFRSADAGKTWSRPQVFNSSQQTSAYASRLRQLRDGTLMLAYEGRKIGYPNHARWQHAGVYLSRDLGKTWVGPDIIAPNEDGLAAYPEPAFVELEDGSLLFLFRIENYPDPKDGNNYHPGNRRQCLVEKKGGHWAAGPITQTALPHGGHPELILTREGILLYVSAEGYWHSLDKGRNWRKVDGLAKAHYYPQAVQLDDGRILVAGHVGEDEPFPSRRDMSIRCQWFRLRTAAK